MLVFVLNKHGTPLMPCKPAKARHLLRDGKAKVVDTKPFTIRLLHGCSGYTQPVTLGVDPGYEYVGLSAVTAKQELYRGEVQLRTDIPKLLATRQMFRRNRRSRKTRYREPRFDNRGKKGWLAPSVRHKLDSHVRLVENIRSILPVSSVVVEVAAFDIQKIKNPDIEGEEYQNGEQKGFSNTREYVLYRDSHRCKHCKGASKDRILQVHHIESRKTGGDAPSNLLTLCKTCHEQYHRGEIDIVAKPSNVGFRAASLMNGIRWRLVDAIGELGFDVGVTFGYKTKQGRFDQQLQKSHSNDAFIIAGGDNTMLRQELVVVQRQVRRNNRKLHKGHHSEIPNRCEREVCGYRLFDSVRYEGHDYFVWGRRKSGYFMLKDLVGNKTERSHKKLEKIYGQTSFLTMLQFPPALKNRAPLEVF